VPEETAQFGWDALAKMLGKSKRSCFRRRKMLIETGAISYTISKNRGGHTYKAMFFFGSIVKAQVIRWGMDGDKF
jgi:hypothetical protein